MTLRMRHVKTNLKRRRRGLPELTFIEFRSQLSDAELRQLEKDARAADELRSAYYHLRKGSVHKGIKALLASVRSNPHYIVDKLKHNVLRMK